MPLFLSYTHDDEAHKARVADLVRRLRNDGLEIVLDQDQDVAGAGPNIGWTKWSELHADEAERVLIVMNSTYRRCWDGKQSKGVRTGAWIEATVFADRVRDAGPDVEFLRVVIFEDDDARHIPRLLRGLQYLHATRDYGAILAWGQINQDRTGSPSNTLGTRLTPTPQVPAEDLRSQPRNGMNGSNGLPRHVMPGDFASTVLIHQSVSEEPLDGQSVATLFLEWAKMVERGSAPGTGVDYLQLSIRNRETIYPDLNDRTAIARTIRELKPLLGERTDGWEQPFFKVLNGVDSRHYFADRFVLVVDKRASCLDDPVPLDLLGPTAYLHLDGTLLKEYGKRPRKYFKFSPKAKTKLREKLRVAPPLCWDSQLQAESPRVKFPHKTTLADCARCGIQQRLGEYLDRCFRDAIVDSLLKGMALFSINNLCDPDNAAHDSRHILYNAVRLNQDFVGGVVLYSQKPFTCEAKQLTDAYKLALLSLHPSNGSPSIPASAR